MLTFDTVKLTHENMDNKKITEIATLGEFGLIEKLTSGFETVNKTTVAGVGDDAAVIDHGGDVYTLLTTEMMLEGVSFDLVYFPLKHLGYKAVVLGCSDILAMNGTPRQLTFSIGVSSKFGVEHLSELYEGVRMACTEYGIDLVGGDTTTSLNGLALSVTVVGEVPKQSIAYRNGAKQNDLICITGDLGAAYMGLHLLEREKRALDGHPNPAPNFEGYEYLLQRQLKPAARKDIVDALRDAGIVPTAMIDLSDGLASDLIQICKSSKCGARIYLDRLPIAKQTYAMAEELNADPVVAALNGGDDHELMFTVPVTYQEQIMRLGGIDVIGHITAEGTGVALVTPDGSDIAVTAPGIAL